MSLYAHRTCICGRSFTTDCTEYTCSQECEEQAWEKEMERREEDEYLSSIAPDEDPS